jgi:hypothetical protein
MRGSGARRVVVPAQDAAAPAAQLTAYELDRAARIRRNQEALAALRVKEAASACAAPAVWRRTKAGAAADAERRPKRPAEAPAPARSSKRIKVRAGLAEPEPADGAPAEAGPDAPGGADDCGRLLTVDEYVERKGLPKGASAPILARACTQPPARLPPASRRARAAGRACACAARAPRAAGARRGRRADAAPAGPLMTGHFRGWVEEGVRAQLGLGASAAVRPRSQPTWRRPPA